jgi:hypothetical protein
MSSSHDPQLVRAYELIKSGQAAQAGALIKNYLADHPRDPDAWWLMAHAVIQPDVKQKCLEKVLAFNPNHAKAREKLDRLQQQGSSLPDPTSSFVMPTDLDPAAPASQFDPFGSPGWQAGGSFDEDDGRVDWGPILGRIQQTGLVGGTTPGAAANDLFDPASAQPGRLEPSFSTMHQGRRVDDEGDPSSVSSLVGIGLIAVAVVVLAAVLLYAANEKGWLHTSAGETSPGEIDGKTFVLRFPETWYAECDSGFLRSARVCAFSTEEKYSLLDLYIHDRDKVSGDSLLPTISQMLFSHNQHPGLVLTGVVMDYSQNGSEYEYIHQSINYSEQLYSSWRGQTNYIRGYDLWMAYEKDNPLIGNEYGYIYWITGKDNVGSIISHKGYFVVADAYVPHGDRMLMLTMFGYSPTNPEEIPIETIRAVIESVEFHD